MLLLLLLRNFPFRADSSSCARLVFKGGTSVAILKVTRVFPGTSRRNFQSNPFGRCLVPLGLGLVFVSGTIPTKRRRRRDGGETLSLSLTGRSHIVLCFCGSSKIERKEMARPVIGTILSPHTTTIIIIITIEENHSIRFCHNQLTDSERNQNTPRFQPKKKEHHR